MRKKLISVIIPARNEEAQIAGTVKAILVAMAKFEGCALTDLNLRKLRLELIIVDNCSTDRTRTTLFPFVQKHGVKLLHSKRLKAPCARNDGANAARGSIYLFVDADTLIPPETLISVCHHVSKGAGAGIFAYAPQEAGLRAWFWWKYWNAVRRLPIARAKAMPALMFCTRDTFEQYGPFDEEVVLGEEWPILADLYSREPDRFVYDRSLVARSSSRRMELQTFGYLRCYIKYLWAILHKSGRIHYADKIRENSFPHTTNSSFDGLDSSEPSETIKVTSQAGYP